MAALMASDETVGVVVFGVILVVLAVRAIGYRREPWWSRWTAVVGVAALGVADTAGSAFFSVAFATVFVIGLILHVVWKNNHPEEKWRPPGTAA